MSKKMILMALAVVGAAFLALPSMASAQEIHLEPAEAFTVLGGGGELRAASQPTVTCSGTSGSGKFDTGSTTTGTLTVDFTGCHAQLFGLTVNCKSSGSALSNTIAISGTFHLITISSGVPGILWTLQPFTIECVNISTIHVTGSVIGTITSPPCGSSSKTLTVSFTATSTTQTHLRYTEVKYDLQSKTGTNGEETTAALVAHLTDTQTTAAKLNCT